MSYRYEIPIMDVKNMEKNNVTYTRNCLVVIIHIFNSYDKICELQYLCLLGKLPLMCKPCVGAKVVLRFQALITHAFLDRSITFLYHISACTSGSICRKRILFISRLGVIVSHFVRGDIFFYSPCTMNEINIFTLISITP